MKIRHYYGVGLAVIILCTVSIVNIATASFFYNGHEYALTSSPLTWQEAEAEAVAWGGHLVTINDQAEQDWLANIFPYQDYPEIYIGMNDIANEGIWVWSSGEPVTYTHWGPNEPNDYNNEDIAVMNYTPYGGSWWNDLPGGYMGIMERSVIFVDIKPDSYPNSINLKAKGVLPVAILTSKYFDATNIDTTTVLFGDPKLQGTAAPIRSAKEDADGNGSMDLLLFFDIPDLVSKGALNASSKEATLTGKTFNGISFSGSDSVSIVPPKKN
ncbi:MAG: C-type lectin domain-containing protein [Chloroflexi bacterium]|nr:C-type lectin domain-containing protein [Chloroflexota bacterium]